MQGPIGLRGVHALPNNGHSSKKIYSFYNKGKKPPPAQKANEAEHYIGLPLRMVPCQTVVGKTLFPALKTNAEIEGQITTLCIALNFQRKADYCGFEALIPNDLF